MARCACGAAADARPVEAVTLGTASATTAPRHHRAGRLVEGRRTPGAFAYVGATVAPGFEFADFGFLRDDAGSCAKLAGIDASLHRLLGA